MPGNCSLALRTLALLTLVVGAEAWFLLVPTRLAQAPLQVHDYVWYKALANNLIDHGTMGVEGDPAQPSYFRTPILPIVMASAFVAADRSLVAFYCVQFVFLALASWVVYLLARNLADHWTGVLAGLLCATSPPLVFLCLRPETEPLSTLLALLVLLAVERSSAGPPMAIHDTAVGIGIGLLVLTRPAFSLLVIPLLLYLLWRRWPSWRGVARTGLAFMMGGGLVVAPWVARNSLLVGGPAGVSSGAGWSLHVSARQYLGDVSYRLLESDWKVILAEHSRRRLAAEAETPATPVRSHAARLERAMDAGYRADARVLFAASGFGAWLRHVPVRLYWLWSTADYFPWGGTFHHLVQGAHVLLMALAAGGVVAVRARWRSWAHMAILPLYLSALHLVFHVEARYTVPARPAVLVFAAIGVQAIGARLRATQATRTRLRPEARQ